MESPRAPFKSFANKENMADEENNALLSQCWRYVWPLLTNSLLQSFPKIKLVLEVLEDRTRLMVQGILYLLPGVWPSCSDIFLWVYANVSGNILGLVGVIAGLTITCFVTSHGKTF